MRSSSIVLAVSLFLAHGDCPCCAQPAEHRGTVPVCKIIFTGDILLDRGVRMAIERHGADHLFSDGIDSEFRSAQIVVVNTEGEIEAQTEEGRVKVRGNTTSAGAKKPYALKFDKKQNLQQLKRILQAMVKIDVILKEYDFR